MSEAVNVQADTGQVAGQTDPQVDNTSTGLGQTTEPQVDAPSTFATQLGAHADLASKFDSVETMAKSYTELESMLGERVTFPKTAHEYAAPEIEGFAVDNDFFDSIRGDLHEGKISQDQLSTMYNIQAKYEMQKHEAQLAQIEQGMNDLESQWGDKYDINMKSANNMVDAINDNDLYELLKNPMFGKNPTLIKAFSTLAGKTGETKLPGSSQPAGGVSVTQASEKLSALLTEQKVDANPQTRAARRVEMDKLHAILNKG